MPDLIESNAVLMGRWAERLTERESVAVLAVGMCRDAAQIIVCCPENIPPGQLLVILHATIRELQLIAKGGA